MKNNAFLTILVAISLLSNVILGSALVLLVIPKLNWTTVVLLQHLNAHLK